MKICIIHGSNRVGNTDKTIDIIKERLNQKENNITYSDIYLPKDLPVFCQGCFACINTGSYGGQNCPHKEYTLPIKEKLLNCDGIIIGCPCYALSETAQIKSLFDHFACTYIIHRPNEEMFNKIGLVVSTAAGAGTKRTISTIRRNLLFWGIKKSYGCGINMWEITWDKMEIKRRIKNEKSIKHIADKFYISVKKQEKTNPSFAAFFLKKFAKFMVSGPMANKSDTEYWKEKGWIVDK